MENGTELRNPAAFVAKIVDYDGGSYSSDGREIRNSHAFVAKMDSAGKGGGKAKGVGRAHPKKVTRKR